MSLYNNWPVTPPSNKEEWDTFFRLVSDIKRQQEAINKIEVPVTDTRYTTIISCAKCGNSTDIKSDSKQTPITLIPVNTLIRRLVYKCIHCSEEYFLLDNI